MPAYAIVTVLLLTTPLQGAGIIGNPTSKLYHRAELAHSRLIENPVHFDSPEDAERAGFAPCPVCFYPYPPRIRAIQEELLLAAQIDAQVRLHYSKWDHPEATADTREALDRILARWPVPLKGYTYRIGFLDTDYLNAIAILAGRIYLTRGLWQSCETADELESLLAMQVAHVEGRHALRSWEASLGFGTLGRILSGFATTTTGLDLTRVINYAKKVVLSGYSQEHVDRAETLMTSTLLTGASRTGARRMFQKLADFYRETGRTRTPFATIPVPDALLVRLDSTRVHPVGRVFASAVPRAPGLTARFTLSRIVCDGTGCQLFGWLEVLRNAQSTIGEPVLFINESGAGSASRTELLLETGSGEVINWILNLSERQLGASTVITGRTVPRDLEALLREVRSVTLSVPYTTALGGNPIGNRLVLTPVSGGELNMNRR